MDAIKFNNPSSSEELQQVMYIDVLPISTLSENAPVEFLVPGSGAQYINLKDTRLYVNCHITLRDGSPLPEIPEIDSEPVKDEAIVSVTNNFLHSLWRQMDIFFGDKLVSSSGLNYPYKSYIDVLLNNGEDAKQSQLQAQMFYKDTGTYMDDSDSYRGANEGLISRRSFFEKSGKVDMEGPIYADIFQAQSSLLLNGVDVRIKLWPSAINFALISANTNPNYKIVLDKVLLRVCKVTVSPSVFLEHEKLLQKTTAKYPYMKADITTRAIDKGQTFLSVENLFQSRIPAKLCVGIVATANYNGAYHLNPFRFKHANVNYMAAYVNGISMPGSPFEPDFSDNENYVREFLSIYQAAGKLGEDSGNFITRTDYRSDYTLYCFDIDPEAQYSLKKQRGNFKLDIRLAEGAKENLTILLYALYPEIIEIDKTRNIILP